jgi:hypothetical protein
MAKATSEATFSPDPIPAPDRKRFWSLTGVSICLLFAVLVPLLMILFRPGIHVAVQNTGSRPLRSVVLFVTGKSHGLGDILPGTSAHTTVIPTGESHLEIQFIDDDGQVRRLDASGYFEPGYRGKIQISIKDGAIDKNEQDITVR